MDREQDDGPIDTLARRHPEHAWTIRQLHRRDEEFRALCEDHGEALRALEYWQRVGGAEHKRAEEYRRLANELENQILDSVKAHGARRRPYGHK